MDTITYPFPNPSYIRELTVMESLSASLALRGWKPSVTDELHRSAVDFTHKGRFLWSNRGHPNPPLTKISLDSRHPQFPDCNACWANYFKCLNLRICCHFSILFHLYQLSSHYNELIWWIWWQKNNLVCRKILKRVVFELLVSVISLFEPMQKDVKQIDC